MVLYKTFADPRVSRVYEEEGRVRSIVQTGKEISLFVNTQLLTYAKQISAWQSVRIYIMKSLIKTCSRNDRKHTPGSSNVLFIGNDVLKIS